MLETIFFLSALVASASTPCTAAAPPPAERTAAARLAAPGTAHHRVLVIHQDFHPNEHYEIAIDGWVTCEDQLAGIRMWWMDKERADERSPFGKGVRRFIDIDYRRKAPTRWTIELRNGRKEFQFAIELDDAGTPRAYGAVELASGQVLDHCRVEHGRLVARKILGLPTGLKRLEVVCVDEDQRRHRGTLRSR